MTPRLLSRAQAAEYCGMCQTTFTEKVKGGHLPPAIPAINKWDKKAIDRKLDQLSGLPVQSELSPLEQWRLERNARQNEGTV